MEIDPWQLAPRLGILLTVTFTLGFIAGHWHAGA